MGYSAKVGSFNIDSTKVVTETQSVTGVGFEPKIVFFWWGGSTATGDSVSGGDIHAGFGAAVSSSSRWNIETFSDDAAADSAVCAYTHTDNCIAAHSDPTTWEGALDFQSMDAGGFTLVVDNQFDNDYRVSYLALGGDDLTNVYLGTKALPSSTGNFTITGVGFEPDCLITAMAVNSTSYADVAVGLATGASNQGVAAGGTQGGAATANTYGYGYNGECYARTDIGGAVYARGAFVSFNSDGCTINALEAPAGQSIVFACLKGGQYFASDLTTRTDSNDIEEDVGFEPVAVLFASANRALSTQDVSTDHNRMSIGAGTATDNRAVAAWSDEDNLADTETAYTNQDDAVYAHVIDDAIEALMDIKSIDSDGFTCVMDDTETSGCWVCYLAIGPVSGDINTEQKRKSAATVGPPINAPSVIPDGSITNPDRQHIAWSYSAISAGGGIFYQSVAGVWTSAGAIARSTATARAGTFTSAGTVTKSTILDALTGALTTAGAVVAQGQKALAGVLTSAGDVVKQTATSTAGTFTSAGDVVKETITSLAGTLTSSGTLDAIKIVLKSLAGTLTTAGDLVKLPQKALSGILSTGGNVVSQAQKALAGALSSAGEVTKQTQTALTGVFTSAGDLASQAIKAVAGTFTSAGELVKETATSIAGTFSATGNVVKSTAISFAGTLTTAGTLVKQGAVALAGTLTSAGVLVKQISKTLVGAFASIGAVAPVLGQEFTKAFVAISHRVKDGVAVAISLVSGVAISDDSADVEISDE